MLLSRKTNKEICHISAFKFYQEISRFKMYMYKSINVNKYHFVRQGTWTMETDRKREQKEGLPT